MQKPYLTFTPDFDQDTARIKEFLQNFESRERRRGNSKKYMDILQQVANKETKLIEIDTEDLESYFQNEEQIPLKEGILKNTKRYLSLFYEAVDTLLPLPTKPLSLEETMEGKEEITQRQRIQNMTQNQSGNQVAQPPQNKSINELYKEGIPKELLRTYEIVIVPGPGAKSNLQKMRDLKSSQIGSLIQVKGIVVRATDVKPCIRVACYSCEICGYETYQVISGRTYMPLIDCTSEQCRNNRSHGKLYAMNRTSKFVSFQEIKIQEPTSEVPVGNVPRSMTVYAFGSNCRQCGPGDTIIVDGIFLPSMMNQARNRGTSRLIHDTYIETFRITKEKKTIVQSKEERERKKIETRELIGKMQNAYETLANSIAPEIYGMTDVKKALLLLLVGGVDKEMEDGMKIRGNLNILLMGDPGIAKSQLLKYISHLSPRGVYTTGKGSSGVGLTAAVVKDNVTNDLVLEGGALVLADMGVCCIDEFDKMSDYDRANIHEVMEQQTVSIAKAGITARLNARTSVLAAANPLYGRYNTSISPHENINLPAALLSRFDLIFLLLDTPNKENDLKLAEHVTQVHIKKEGPKKIGNSTKLLSEEQLRDIIANAKTFNPVIPKDLHNFIVQKYVEKRKEEEKEDKQGYQYITPRSLLAILRLAQALAKIRCQNEVSNEEITEALRLVEVGKSTVENQKDAKPNIVKTDYKSIMFALLRTACSESEKYTVKYSKIQKEICGKGYTKAQFNAMITEYVNLNVIYVDENNTEITLLV